MFNMFKKMLQYPRVTIEYPYEPAMYPYRSTDHSLTTGKPEIDKSRCTLCGECVLRCPSSAIVMDKDKDDIGINIDECIYCALCQEVCPTGAAQMTHEYEFAEKTRDDLRQTPLVIEKRHLPDESYEVTCNKIKSKIAQTYRRSLHIREVDAGSCNGCDYEVNALNNPLNDVERLGIDFVASPRHADMLLVTGAVTRNMELALIKTYNAAPDDKLVVAVGACACSGGIFRDSYATRGGIDIIIPVDVYVPGCPPRPQAIIYGILKAIDRV